METFSALLAICAGNSPLKGQWREALMFSFICVRINCWENNREAGDLRLHRAHYDVIVMTSQCLNHCWSGSLTQICVSRQRWDNWDRALTRKRNCDQIRLKHFISISSNNQSLFKFVHCHPTVLPWCLQNFVLIRSFSWSIVTTFFIKFRRVRLNYRYWDSDHYPGYCGRVASIQYIPRNMHTVLLCFALLWLCNRS